MWQLAFYASVTGFDFFVIRWCCLASGWDVGPMSDYQLLCMKHLPLTNGPSLEADVCNSILPWLLLSCSMHVIGVTRIEVWIVFTV